MRKYLIFLCTSLLILHVNAQVKFEKYSLKEAISLAKKENKLIFVQLESLNCSRCNEVANASFKNSFPIALQNRFIFLKLNSSNPDREFIDNLYPTKNLAGTLFLNSDGTLIHRYTRTSSMQDDYYVQANIAIEKANKFGNISINRQIYNTGNRSFDFLEKYITELNELSLAVDTLLNEYVSLLPPDSTTSPRVIKFIAGNAPILGSIADNLLRKDYPLFNKVWFSRPLTERININNKIISKSKTQAISRKDVNYIKRVATFAKNTYDKNSFDGERIYNSIFLDYYKQIKDTINYLEKAIDYYDRYLMTVSVDWAKQQDELEKNEKISNAKLDTIDFGEGIILQRSAIISPKIQNYANELNEGAWNFYKMTNDVSKLMKGLEWAKASLKFYTKSDNLDTYARLLYKIGKRTEAIEQEKKAIAFDKKTGLDAIDLELVLKRMEAGLNDIDK